MNETTPPRRSAGGYVAASADLDVQRFHAVFAGFFAGILGGNLRRIRRGFPAALEALAAGRRPGDRIALGVRDGDHGVVERGRDMSDAGGDVLTLLAARPSCGGGFRHFDAYVALGCVVQGETDHYEHVCREAMAGLTQITLANGTTQTFTTDDPGRLLLTGQIADLGMLDVTNLHGISRTAPYFHNNSAATLEEVVDHYVAVFKRAARINPPPNMPPLVSSNGTDLDRGFINDDEREALLAYLRKL